MIFFRVHTARIKRQRGDETFLLFGKLKASFSAPVDELSGMTVNLKDVDQWMSLALAKAPAFNNLDEALEYFYKTLKKLSSAFIKAEISLGSVISSYDGTEFSRTYRLRTWFKKDRTWVQRPFIMKSKKPLSKKFRIHLRQKKWSSTEAFAKILKVYLPSLQVLEIQNPDWKGSEKFHF